MCFAREIEVNVSQRAKLIPWQWQLETSSREQRTFGMEIRIRGPHSRSLSLLSRRAFDFDAFVNLHLYSMQSTYEELNHLGLELC